MDSLRLSAELVSPLKARPGAARGAPHEGGEGERHDGEEALGSEGEGEASRGLHRGEHRRRDRDHRGEHLPGVAALDHGRGDQRLAPHPVGSQPLDGHPDLRQLRPAVLEAALAAEEVQACGATALVTAFRAAQALGATRATVLAYTSSGDVTGRTEPGAYTVGYMAAVVYQ